MSSDLYADLGVSRTATDAEVKQAYKRLAMKHHPDRNPGDKQAEERFKRVAHAFEVLGDSDRRKLYNEFGEDALRSGFDADRARAYQRWAGNRGGPGSGGFDVREGPAGFGGFGGAGGFEDILGSVFGGRRPGRRGRGAPPRPVEASVEVDLAAAIDGAEIPLRLELRGPSGAPESRNLRVRLPRGVGAGDKIRLKGQGEPDPFSGARGDLILNVDLRVAAPFARTDGALYLDLPITIHEALTGAAVEVPLPEGKKIKLKVAPGSQSGDKLRVRGKGLPGGRGHPRGDLIVRLLVKLPEPSAELLRVAQELDSGYRDTVRDALQV